MPKLDRVFWSSPGKRTGFHLWKLFVPLVMGLSVFQPTAVAAENLYTEHEITPFSYSEDELEEGYFEDSDVSFQVPLNWGVSDDGSVLYPKSSNLDEDVTLYLLEVESSSLKDNIDDSIDYVLKEEPIESKTTITGSKTSYYELKSQPFACVSYKRTYSDKGKKTTCNEIVYILPVDKKLSVVVTVTLWNNKTRSYTKEEEALLLTVTWKGQPIFKTYLDSLKTGTRSTTSASVSAPAQRSTSTTTTTAVGSTSAPEPEPAQVPASSYVLNTNTMKFHKPGCASVKKMKASNRWDYTGTRDDVIAMGYVPCKKCNP